MAPGIDTNRPQRRCVVCRTRAPKEALVRLTCDDQGQWSVDLMQRRPGRGRYLCTTARCLLRKQIDPSGLLESVQRALREVEHLHRRHHGSVPPHSPLARRREQLKQYRTILRLDLTQGVSSS